MNLTWPTLPPSESQVQNQYILQQWEWCMQLERHRQLLFQYMDRVANIGKVTRPLLNVLEANSSVLESLEFRLKDSVEYYSSNVRQMKLRDCSYNGNCGKALIIHLLMMRRKSSLWLNFDQPKARFPSHRDMCDQYCIK